jgi:hypothetical protein
MTGPDYFLWSYAAQKYSESVDALAGSFGPNWQRMTFAIMPLLILDEKDFPDREFYVRTTGLTPTFGTPGFGRR